MRFPENRSRGPNSIIPVKRPVRGSKGGEPWARMRPRAASLGAWLRPVAWPVPRQVQYTPPALWHAAKLSLTKLWGWQERGWFCCAAFREFAMQPGQPVVTTPVRALVQTGNLQPRASARSAAFERSFFGRPYGRGWGLRPSEPRAHARGHIEGASSLRVRGSRDRNGQQNRDDLEPTARPSFHHPTRTPPPATAFHQCR